MPTHTEILLLCTKKKKNNNNIKTTFICDIAVMQLSFTYMLFQSEFAMCGSLPIYLYIIINVLCCRIFSIQRRRITQDVGIQLRT